MDLAIMPVAIENRAGLPDPAFAILAESLTRQTSIRHAIDWLTAHDPPIAPSGMVTQDEFSFDILVAYPGGLWLSYDST